jgi:glycosyltransferase involved in cell wall biosynthesis
LSQAVIPDVLLLQEDSATGGVNTMIGTLLTALNQDGERAHAMLLQTSGWLERFRAARKCEVILASNNFRPAYVAWVLSTLARKPAVIWVHGPVNEVLLQARASLLRRILLRSFYRRMRRLVFVSEASFKSYLRFMGRAAPGNQSVSVIPNAVSQTDSPHAAPMRQPDTTGTVELAYIGRLAEEKRPGLLLEMLRLLPARFRLSMVGDGPLGKALQTQGRDLIAEGRLAFLGPQAHGPALYLPWHLTLLASRYEGCPMTLLESFAAGVPCAATPIAAVTELLGAEGACMLSADASPQAMAEAVQRVLLIQPEVLRRAMTEILSRHRVQAFVQRWQDVLAEAHRLRN